MGASDLKRFKQKFTTMDYCIIALAVLFFLWPLCWRLFGCLSPIVIITVREETTDSSGGLWS